MSFEQTVSDAVERAFQKQVMPLLLPVLEQMKFVSVPKKEAAEELWDTKQTGKYLGLAAITLEMYRPEGRGPDFLRIGNRIRYRKSDVIAFAEKNKNLLGRKGRPPQELVEQVKQSGLVVDGCHSTVGRARKVGR